MGYATRTGAVLFATGLRQVAAFYSSVLGLSEASHADDHIVLDSPGFQLVVHRISDHTATAIQTAKPPTRRTDAAFKPVFFVPSLATARTIVSAHGGAMEPPDKEWSLNGVAVCDALDPEGNVIQFREIGD